MNNLFLVFLGGGLGSLARYGVAAFVWNNYKTAFPAATFISNIVSCLVLALTVSFFSGKIEISPALRTFIIIGFCGGFSTFSTFSFETVELMRSGNMTIAIANILVSVSACIALIWFITKETI
jgi:fluoride exporter